MMWSGFQWVFKGLLAASALLGMGILASLSRPSPSVPVPPSAKPAARWLWFDRCIRYERWHPPITVVGTYWSSGSSPDSEVFVSRRNVTYDTASRPNGTITARTFDFWQFNLWRAAAELVPLTAMFGLAIWWHHRRSPSRPGFCTACGYDLRASKDQCPECGTPIVVEVKA